MVPVWLNCQRLLLKQVTYLYPGWHVRAVNRHEGSSNAKSAVEAQW